LDRFAVGFHLSNASVQCQQMDKRVAPFGHSVDGANGIIQCTVHDLERVIAGQL
jgi:hypothetical protein